MNWKSEIPQTIKIALFYIWKRIWFIIEIPDNHGNCIISLRARYIDDEQCHVWHRGKRCSTSHTISETQQMTALWQKSTRLHPVDRFTAGQWKQRAESAWSYVRLELKTAKNRSTWLGCNTVVVKRLTHISHTWVNVLCVNLAPVRQWHSRPFSGCVNINRIYFVLKWNLNEFVLICEQTGQNNKRGKWIAA